jgi:NADH:ubiquinone oxidoreductase subunit 2 (subunit N)
LWLQASLAAGQWPWVLVLALGTLPSAVYVFRVLRCSFVEDAPEPVLRSLPTTMELIALALALAAIGLGLAAAWPLAFLTAAVAT